MTQVRKSNQKRIVNAKVTVPKSTRLQPYYALTVKIASRQQEGASKVGKVILPGTISLPFKSTACKPKFQKSCVIYMYMCIRIWCISTFSVSLAVLVLATVDSSFYVFASGFVSARNAAVVEWVDRAKRRRQSIY